MVTVVLGKVCNVRRGYDLSIIINMIWLWKKWDEYHM